MCLSRLKQYRFQMSIYLNVYAEKIIQFLTNKYKILAFRNTIIDCRYYFDNINFKKCNNENVC